MESAIRVLLVDDEEEFSSALSRALTRRGLCVSSARDGQLALDILDGQAIDVVVLDLRMPTMDGLSMLAAMRSRGHTPPVLMLSGHADLTRAGEAMTFGAVDFLLKPCPVETLLAAIEDAHERALIARQLDPREALTPSAG